MSESGELFIEERKGAVVVTLTNPTHEIYSILPPQQAQDIAQVMAKYAYHAQSGRDDIGRKIISDVWKAKMLTRCTGVIKRELEKGRKPGFIANNLLDIILSEVT